MKQALLIVAHPDDELLWFGGLLLTQKHLDWTIISVTYSKNTNRGREFLTVCKKLKAEGILLGFEDKENVLLDEDKLFESLLLFYQNYKFGIVFTHNINGEYGHPHHRQISRITQSIWKNVITSGYGADKINYYIKLPYDIIKQKQDLAKNYFTGDKCNRIKAYPAYAAKKEPYCSRFDADLPSLENIHEVSWQKFSNSQRLALKEVDKVIKVLILADAPGWAHQAIINNLVFNVGPFFKIDVIYFSNSNFTKLTHTPFDHRDYDLIHLFSPRYLILIAEKQIPAEKIVTTVHSHRVLEAEKKAIVSREYFKAVSVVSKKLFAELKKSRKDVWLTPCGVDTQLFHPKEMQKGQSFSVCSVARKYNAESNDDIKGLNKILLPLAKKFDFTILSEAKYANNAMPEFYNKHTVYACASKSEGSPLPVLEAASCGRVVVSTDVGITPEILNDETIISRDLDSFNSWLNWARSNPESIIKLGKENRKKMLIKRDWAVVIKYWRDFYLNALK